MYIKQILEQLGSLVDNSHEELYIAGVSREFCSYRGHYSELCVTPSVGRKMTVCEFSNVLADQIGNTYEGYKGGEYTMTEGTELYMATYGNLGEKIVGIEKDGNNLSFVTEEETW